MTKLSVVETSRVEQTYKKNFSKKKQQTNGQELFFFHSTCLIVEFKTQNVFY